MKKCDPSRCLCTPQAFVDAFLQTPNLSGTLAENPGQATATYPFPICVGDHLFARVNGGNVPPASSTIAPLVNSRAPNVPARRRAVFVFDNKGLERILALGQYRAKRILELVGFGVISNFRCSDPIYQQLLVYSLKQTQTPASCKRKNPSTCAWKVFGMHLSQAFTPLLTRLHTHALVDPNRQATPTAPSPTTATARVSVDKIIFVILPDGATG